MRSSYPKTLLVALFCLLAGKAYADCTLTNTPQAVGVGLYVRDLSWEVAPNVRVGTIVTVSRTDATTMQILCSNHCGVTLAATNSVAANVILLQLQPIVDVLETLVVYQLQLLELRLVALLCCHHLLFLMVLQWLIFVVQQDLLPVEIPPSHVVEVLQ